MVSFRMSSSSFVQCLPSASSRAAPFRSPQIQGSDDPASTPAGSERSGLERRNSVCASRVTFRGLYQPKGEWNMKERLLITTAIGLMLGTGAFAQSPNDKSKTEPPRGRNARPIKFLPTSPPPSSPSSDKSPTATSQSTPNTGDTSSQAQSNQGQSTNNTATTPSNNAGTAPSQTQSTQQPNAPSQAQTNTAPPTNNQTQAAPTGSNTNTNAGTQPSTNTAAQPSNTQSNTAQSGSSNVSVSASLNETQRTRVTESIARLNVAPINNVNFSLSVGTAVPRDVRFQPLPAEVVEILPQYRGYNFFVVRDDIAIVEPSTYKIVDVLPRTGRSTAAAPGPAPSSHKATFSDKDREIIRKHARSSRTEQRTTASSTTTTRVRHSKRLPESVEIRSFPETVYRASPSLREYRYIERDNRTYVIEPRERTIIEEID